MQQLAALLVCLIEGKGHSLLNLTQGNRACAHARDNPIAGLGWILLMPWELPASAQDHAQQDQNAESDQDSGRLAWMSSDRKAFSDYLFQIVSINHSHEDPSEIHDLLIIHALLAVPNLAVPMGAH